jgi:NAD(P)H-nitrite reductase large subunit
LRIKLVQARATRVDPATRTVVLDNGQQLGFDTLLIATGSTPVRPPIPGINLPGVHPCWTLEDARQIMQLAVKGARVLQMGAGFIGCIIMEALAKRGVQLTVVEMGDRMVPRMMTPTAGGMIKRWVEGKGIRVLTSAGVQRIDRGSEAPLAVTLTTGDRLDCDLVIVAAGVAPNVGFLDETPVHVAKGVLVDAHMATSVPGIFAAGDVAEAPDLFTGAHLVAAIQPNAADQARVAAINMARGDGGQATRLNGVLAINVLDTLGLISSSFGQWWGEQREAGGASVELVDDVRYRYLSLQFRDDVLIGATAIGLTEHVGVLRGLIHGKVRLGAWKDRLLAAPLQFVDAYVARSQQPMALAR